MLYLILQAYCLQRRS